MPSKIGQFGDWKKEDLEKYARENLNEDPKRTESDIKAIKEWIKKQPHLNKNVRNGKHINQDEGVILKLIFICTNLIQDDELVLTYLRGCKFSLERTKEKIDMYNTCRAACPEWFGNMDPEEANAHELLKRG